MLFPLFSGGLVQNYQINDLSYPEVKELIDRLAPHKGNQSEYKAEAIKLQLSKEVLQTLEEYDALFNKYRMKQIQMGCW